MDMDRGDKSLFLIFSHEMTRLQMEDAERSLGIINIIEMPDNLRELWKQIPPIPAEINDILEPLRQWLGHSAHPLDFVLIQGDFGATWLMVDFAFKQGLVPLYSTTIRKAEEALHPDGSVKTEHVFQHQIFRRYGR